MQATIDYNRRDSSQTSYLALEYAAKTNLNIVTNARVTRVLPSKKEKDGKVSFRTVEFQSSNGGELSGPHLPLYRSNRGPGKVKKLTAKKEVIIAAGTVGTPALLMYSGIGDKAELKAAGVKHRVDLPSVGKNLTDHPLLTNQWLVNSTDTRDEFFRNQAVQTELLGSYLAGGGKFLVDSPASQIGFMRLPENHPIFETEEDPSAGPITPHYELVTAVSRLYTLLSRHVT